MNWRRPVALLVALAPLAACATPPDAATVLASARGTGPADAYAVSSAAQEHEILRLLGVELQSKALHVIDGQAFDVLTVRSANGETRDLWFDISRFFRRGY